MRILIVEDEVNAREGLAELLSRISPENTICGKASDGEQGLLLFKKYKPDLVFVDIEMPKLNGLQMIEKIRLITEEPFFVILSGYSDFKYAQKSIRLGVTEYLLKPVTYSDLKSVMADINRKANIKKERNKIYEKDIPREEILEKIILQSKDTQEAYRIIESYINQEEYKYLINFYIPGEYKSKTQLIINKISDFLLGYNIKTFYYSLINEYNYITIFINTTIDFLEVLKIVKYNLLFSLRESGFSGIIASAITLNTLNDIKGSLERFKRLSKWSITLDNEEIIHDELISKLKIENCNYPRELENEMLSAIKDNDFSKLLKINEKMIAYIKTGIYDPDRVIEIFMNYAFSMLTFLKNCNNNLYNEIKDAGILDDLRESHTRVELKNHLDTLVKKIYEKCCQNPQINSLPVRKAINFIKEHYSDRISLEEIACKMNITPEYLSRLFTREVGKCFSDYLKEFRIEKAKRLIINNNMKIYKVAEEVGYNDPKYFSKMFKEVTGMTPKEYMEFY